MKIKVAVRCQQVQWPEGSRRRWGPSGQGDDEEMIERYFNAPGTLVYLFINIFAASQP